jgi:hypothetical protein
MTCFTGAQVICDKRQPGIVRQFSLQERPKLTNDLDRGGRTSTSDVAKRKGKGNAA